MSSLAVAASAPGKVLFAGGFLVLDRKHTGLVFGLNARIHVHIQPWLGDDGGASIPRGKTLVQVQSPQFLEARWLYEINQSDQGRAAVNVTQVMDLEDYTKGSNKFVETTLRYALTYLTYLSRDIEKRVKITILADNDYYSQPSESSGTQSDSPFKDFGVKLSDAHKTGLGSSAALVTALVSAIVIFFAGDDATQEAGVDYRRIHNLAQAAHCAAQGKVGSGFDVAAAVYGSCLYRRFSPAILEDVGEPSSLDFTDRLGKTVQESNADYAWDVEVASHAVQIPNSLLLIMCDVDCGSETPGMVRKVLQWRKDKPEEADQLWDHLQTGQEELCEQLRHLSNEESRPGGFDEFEKLGDVIMNIRSLVREMSSKSQVPIEPPVITELLDFCTSLPGVVGGVAPGAGGYDAVALLVRNDIEVVRDLQSRLEGWKSKDATGATIGNVRLLGVKQEKEGVRKEQIGLYKGWLS